MDSAEASLDARGIRKLKLGGKTYTIKFRAHELRLLEERLKKSGEDKTIPQILESGSIGFLFLNEALLVGVAHNFVGKKGKEARISPQMVAKWIDDHPDFGELSSTVVEAVVLGLPGAKQELAEAKAKQEAEEAEDAAAGAPDDNPLSSSTSDPSNGSTGQPSKSSPPSTESTPQPSTDTPETSTPATP